MQDLTPVKVGAHIFGVGPLAEPGALADAARLAEELGYHSVFLADHVLVPRQVASRYPYSRDGSFPYAPELPWLDPMVALGYLAARTTTIRLGTSITVVPMRNPIVTAKQVASADHLSGGRVIFGVGVGWLEEEFTLLGASFHDRGRRMDEYLRLMKVLWTEDHPRFAGEYFEISDCGFAPKPVQKPHVPLWIGGESPAALRRAARLGDGWHSAATALADLPGKLRILREALDGAGRAAAGFTISVSPTDRLTPEVVRDFAAQGVGHLLAPVFSLDGDRVRQRLERIATQVIAPYRRG